MIKNKAVSLACSSYWAYFLKCGKLQGLLVFIVFITFIGRTDAEPETPILWPPGMKNQITGKDPDAGKD